MRTRLPPGILFAIHDGKTVIADVIAAIFVDGVRVRWGGDVEGVAAYQTVVFEGEEAGDEG